MRFVAPRVVRTIAALAGTLALFPARALAQEPADSSSAVEGAPSDEPPSATFTDSESASGTPPPDSSSTPPDSSSTPPDSSSTPPDSSSTPPDGSSSPPESAPPSTRPYDDPDPYPSSSSTPRASSAPPTREEEEEEFNGGLYFDANLGGMYGIRSTHAWKDDCPAVQEIDWNPSCKTTVPLGFAAEGRLGFRFGPLGLEAFALAAGDWSSGKLEGQEPSIPLPAFATDMHIGRIGGGLGGGLRLTTTGLFRVALGVGGGVMFRHVYSNISSLDGSSTGYTAPIVKGDLTFTIVKFLNIGLMGWVEFSPDIVLSPNLAAAGGLAGVPDGDPSLQALEDALGDVTVLQGAQYFIGPYLGFHFGN